MPITAGQPIRIEAADYRFGENPNMPGSPYGRDGQCSTVYQLSGETGTLLALKVFQPRFRRPRTAELPRSMLSYAMLPGLQVCERTTLAPDRYAELLARQPELAYSVFMPWVEGDTWQQVLLARRQIPATQALRLARSLAYNLAAMEERSLAHCDLNGQNLLVKIGAQTGYGNPVALVDLEEMYIPGVSRPDSLPLSLTAYSHQSARGGSPRWGPEADRFGGAVLIAEMLGMCDEAIVQSGLGESYFDPGEMGVEGRRYDILYGVLLKTWGDGVARNFALAWHSESTERCPAFSDWLAALPNEVPLRISPVHPVAPTQVVQINSANPPVTPLQSYTSASMPSQNPLDGQPPYPDVPPQPGGPGGTMYVQPSAGAQDQFAYLFDQANAAYSGGQFQQAEAMLVSIVTANPGYYRGGVYASDLLSRVQAEEAQQRKGRQMKWLIPLLLIGGLLLCGIALAGGYLAGNWFGKPTTAATFTAVTPNFGPAIIPPTNTSAPVPTTQPALAPPPTNTLPPTYTPYPTYTNPPQPTLPPPPPPPTYTPYVPPTNPPVASCCTLKVTNRGSDPLYIGSSMPYGGAPIQPGWYVTFKVPGPQQFTVYYCEISATGKAINCTSVTFDVQEPLQEESVP